MSKFEMSTGPRTAEQIAAAADTIEKQVGAIARGSLRAGQIDLESLATLVQWARDSMGEIDRLNWLILHGGSDFSLPEFADQPFTRTEEFYLRDVRERINRVIARTK